MKRNNLILDKSFDLAVRIVNLNKYIVSDKTEYIEDKIYNSLNDNIQELLKLLVSIIKLSKNKKYNK